MRLGILGDIHGYVPGSHTMCIDYAVQLTAAVEVEAFLQVGDMCHYRSFARPVHWIYGNNDWPDVVRQIETGERPLRHLHHLRTGAVLTLDDGTQRVRIAGLNGAFDELYYGLSPEAERPLESLAYFIRDDVERCLPLRQIDIFLAHGCPAGLGYGREPDHGVPAIREILDTVQPRLMLCGHAHFFHAAHSGQSTVYSLKQLRDAYYILDTERWTLEAFPCRSLP